MITIYFVRERIKNIGKTKFNFKIFSEGRGEPPGTPTPQHLPEIL